ncbi:MAG: F0F1 ATP synthase subunit B [Buchnera aphidicola (Eriosoma harunire)]
MNLNATIIGQTISFIFFVWFCMKYIWPPIIKIIHDRKTEIENAFNLIKKKEIEIEIEKKNIQKTINKAKHEAEIIIQNANQNKKVIIAEAKLLANKEREKILLNTQLEIQNKTHKIFNELKKKTTNLSILIAEKILKKTINEKDHQNYINEILSNF